MIAVPPRAQALDPDVSPRLRDPAPVPARDLRGHCAPGARPGRRRPPAGRRAAAPALHLRGDRRPRRRPRGAPGAVRHRRERGGHPPAAPQPSRLRGATGGDEGRRRLHLHRAGHPARAGPLHPRRLAGRRGDRRRRRSRDARPARRAGVPRRPHDRSGRHPGDEAGGRRPLVPARLAHSLDALLRHLHLRHHRQSQGGDGRASERRQPRPLRRRALRDWACATASARTPPPPTTPPSRRSGSPLPPAPRWC